jgi:hypothetical protein
MPKHTVFSDPVKEKTGLMPYLKGTVKLIILWVFPYACSVKETLASLPRAQTPIRMAKA